MANMVRNTASAYILAGVSAMVMATVVTMEKSRVFGIVLKGNENCSIDRRTRNKPLALYKAPRNLDKTLSSLKIRWSSNTGQYDSLVPVLI